MSSNPILMMQHDSEAMPAAAHNSTSVSPGRCWGICPSLLALTRGRLEVQFRHHMAQRYEVCRRWMNEFSLFHNVGQCWLWSFLCASCLPRKPHRIKQDRAPILLMRLRPLKWPVNPDMGLHALHSLREGTTVEAGSTGSLSSQGMPWFKMRSNQRNKSCCSWLCA